ncbi:patatin-like phospholipase family protein [Pseudoxanthobacter sp.]|uniref:patatin-like phospholipase family protein n=1 Tax=Pseudoxanthobacter sp. TaxID=1925742 RepID=UPI002FE18261
MPAADLPAADLPAADLPDADLPGAAPSRPAPAAGAADAGGEGLRIGVALSGGGARGLAHAAVISAFDEMGLKPAAIAGASIGALVGAGWAGGLTGSDIAELARARFADSRALIASLWQLRPQRLSDLFGANAMVSLDAGRVIDLVLPGTLPEAIEDLPVRFTAIGTDFYGWNEVRFSAGPLKPALAASIALPAVFRTVSHEGRVLMDGGFSNPLPFDALPRAVDFVVAVDVVGGPQPDAERRQPGPTEALFGASQIMMQALITEKLKHRRAPDLVVRPDINRFRVLDFLKAGEVLAAARPVTEAVRRALEAALEARERTRRDD